MAHRSEPKDEGQFPYTKTSKGPPPDLRADVAQMHKVFRETRPKPDTANISKQGVLKIRTPSKPKK